MIRLYEKGSIVMNDFINSIGTVPGNDIASWMEMWRGVSGIPWREVAGVSKNLTKTETKNDTVSCKQCETCNNTTSKSNEEVAVDIIDFTYDENTGVSTVYWTDGTHTSMWAENKGKFYGFVCAVAKKLFGIDYRYNAKTGETTIKWADGIVTTAKAESLEQADQFFGLIMTIMKRMTDNRILDAYEQFGVKLPEYKKKAFEQAEKEAEANAKSDAKAAKRRHDWAVRREAVRIKREYEARLLANEKWGVPLDFDSMSVVADTQDDVNSVVDKSDMK